YQAALTALQSLGNLEGKVVIDITNPLTADYMGLTIGHSTSAAEEIAKALPGVELVKGFNTLFAQVLASGPTFANEQQGSVFLA
ncbi:NADPH-dependent F420 reductase, partial [Pseudomonas aeruginosa]